MVTTRTTTFIAYQQQNEYENEKGCDPWPILCYDLINVRFEHRLAIRAQQPL